MCSHESVIENLEGRGQELISSGHFASDTIKESKKIVHDTWTKLQEATIQRTMMLNDSLDVQGVRLLHEFKEVLQGYVNLALFL